MHRWLAWAARQSAVALASTAPAPCAQSDKNSRGYSPLYEQKLDPKNQTSGDTKESIYIWGGAPWNAPHRRWQA
jgi:hypothetical protein